MTNRRGYHGHSPTATYSVNCGPCGCIILIILAIATLLGLAQMIGFVF
jgi:hypothetical protein